MNPQTLLITFSLSLMFLIISANFLLKFIEKFAGRIKISPLIVGATVIAIGTSLPETFVAFSAISQSAADISFGNIIGSNIANICLIFGLGILLFPIRIGTQKTQRNNIIMLITTVVFVALLFIAQPLRKSLAFLVIFLYIVFLVVETIWGEIGKKKEDKKALKKLATRSGNPIVYFGGILISIAGLLVSSHYLVSSIISFSEIFKISEGVIGLSVLAIGTCLPELATTLISGIDKDWKLLYGNLQGSSIYNFAVIGSILTISNKSGYQIPSFALITLALSTVATVYLSHKYEGSTIPRIFGAGYLALYAFYIFRIYHI